MDFMSGVRRRVQGRGTRVVLAEGLEERALRAAVALSADGLAHPVLVGSTSQVASRGRELGLDLAGLEIRDPATDPDVSRYVERYVERRRHKGMTTEQAASRVAQAHYFAALMVDCGDADGMVSGLCSETKPFIPAFEVVRLRQGLRRASSVFVMTWPERVLFYADCSVNIAPDAAGLAEIGRATAATARAFGHEPQVAFLSFSTRDSASDPSIERVKQAVALVRQAEPDLPVDGELQFDAAFVPEVASRKCPDSPLAGRANVFVFPDLNAGNIAYKITERLAGAAAVGPILQGLRKPVNDVSRGCSVQDLCDVAVMTAAQALSPAD